MYQHAIYLQKDDVYCYSFELTLPFRLKIGDQVSAECMQHEAELTESVMDTTEQLDSFFTTYDRFLIVDAVIESAYDLTVVICPIRSGALAKKMN